MLSSQMCKRETLVSPEFLAWADLMRPAWDEGRRGVPVLMHRKLWEWLFITQALAERGMLAPGRRGLGFGVGQEPLAALFASLGCSVVATDMPEEDAQAVGWTSDGQFAGDMDALNRHGLCPPELFRERVTFRTVDMNRVPDDLRGFDFTWSSCAFEHLGSLRNGLDFVVNQMRCLRPGGVSIHTTEFNVSSDTDTIDHAVTVLYRRSDLRRLGRRLALRGHKVDLDFTPGTSVEDRHVDVPPFSEVHLRTTAEEHVTTSYGLVIEKRGRRHPAPA